MIINAPAKINLYLKVLSKRDDGFHQIETLFERVSLFDRISVEPSERSTQITCDNSSVPTDENSLLGKVVRDFMDKTGIKKHFKVSVEKHIPISAGLGGGSSDAAALLKGLNELEGHPLEEDNLTEIGGKIGSDVPFFLSNSSFAYGKERGERITRVDSRLNLHHILINPPFEISTKDVYGRVSAFSLTKSRPVDKMFTSFLNNNNIKGITENLHNDLQHVVLRDFPRLEKVFSELRKAGAEGVLLSGSGPTVFGIFTSGTTAIEAGKELEKIFPEGEGWKVFVVKTC